MFRKTFHIVVWLLVVLAVEYALCQEPLPILELDTPDEADKIQHSECVNGVVSDLDLFTVRGRINKNGSNSYVDTNLYLQAAIDPITNNWESQCRPNLKVCGVNLNTDCYCERKDQDGYYHLVMKIVVKSIYSGAKLRLSWNDNPSPQNSFITSNIVDYYPGSIREREFITFKIVGTNGMILDQNLTHDDTKTIPVTYTPEMRNVTFCVFNLATNRFIQIEDGGDILVNTRTNPCVVLDLSETSSSRNLTITFMELEECKREGLFILTLEPGKESDGLEIPLWGSTVLYISIPFILLFGICAVSKAVSVKKDCRRYRTTGYKQSKKQKRNPYVSKPFYESSVFTVDTELNAVETNPNANKETSPNANIEMSPKANKETSPNANKETDPDANKEANPNANKETNLNPDKKINPNANKEMNPNANKETNPNANKGTNPNVNKEMNPNANKETNSNANKETNSNANKEMNPNANRETDPNANKETNSNANKEMNPNANRETDPNANKGTNPNVNKEMNPNANRETDPNANKETNSNANKEMNPNANRETDPNANNRQIPMPTKR